MTTYLVHCSRILEVASLAYFTSEGNDRERVAAFLEDFIRNEPGSRHPLSDRYAVSLVLAVLALCDNGRTGTARDLVRLATVWLCDRYQDGMGLAGLESDELDETKALLGYAFDFVDLPQRRSSFLATALADLSAFVGDYELYGAVINDIEASRIHPQYFQPRDSLGACSIEGEDVTRYPTIAYVDDVAAFNIETYGNHIIEEWQSFRFADTLGPISVVTLSALLRDRYFPRMWQKIAPGFVQRS
jgi:hypothetical protein